MSDQSSSQDKHESVPPIPLTEGQRRAIGSLLTQVARVVGQVESVVGARLDERLSYSETEDTLSAEERTSLQAALTILVREANTLALLSRAPTQVADARATLSGAFSILWSDAEETSPSRLGGYGQVRPEARVALAPHTRALARVSLLLAHIISGQMSPAAVRRTLETFTDGDEKSEVPTGAQLRPGGDSELATEQQGERGIGRLSRRLSSHSR